MFFFVFFFTIFAFLRWWGGAKGGGGGHRYSLLQPVPIFKGDTCRCEISFPQAAPWFFIFVVGQIKQQLHNSFLWLDDRFLLSGQILKFPSLVFFVLVVWATIFAKLLNFLINFAFGYGLNDAEEEND